MTDKPAVLFAAATDIGLVRAENQDAFGIFPESDDPSPEGGRLFIVADGMGGHRGGKEASALAVRTIAEMYRTETLHAIPDRIESAIQTANELIYRTGTRSPGLRGMGTTCVVLAHCGGEAFIGHVGDSRAYLITRTEVRQLTKDHSTVAELQRRGLLTPQQAKYHPERAMLYRALGVDPVVDVDLHPPMALQGGEWFLLCTDGLTTMVEDAEIAEIVVSLPPQDACKGLIRRANDQGGFDNTTVIVIQVTDPAGPPRARSTG